ncbi:hypothetical protein [Miniphocaeibacter massiliensis]|uniref:hypothetical protein n=1 Tax=Miniphocaeibacter massiliensis TaxID=2041841 RepID=UPI000C1B81BC|nr:hypothetical protein [Miniphocaeibacter massiliensis]
MPLDDNIKNKIYEYCNNHLANEYWYTEEFKFIKDNSLKERLIKEFRAIRFAYKIYEGIEADKENLIFEVRNQILGYATLYEAIIEYVLNEYYYDTLEYENLTHHTIPIKISIPNEKQKILENELYHDGKKIVPFYYDKRKKEKTKIRFDDKCKTAEEIGLIYPFKSKTGSVINLTNEIIEIYGFRNGIHIIAEQRKNIKYELELSKKAYMRMKPFIMQIKSKLEKDGFI